MRLGSIIACAALSQLLIAASQPVRLQPSSRWVLDYAENSCRLLRKFGAGDTETVLLFESEAPDEMDMVLIGKPLRADGEDVQARFLPAQTKPDIGRSVKSADGQPGILFARIQLYPEEAKAKLDARIAEIRKHPHDRPPRVGLAEQQELKAQRHEFASKTTEIEIDARSRHPVLLETGSMGNAIAMLDHCSLESLKDWGADPALEDKIVRSAWLENMDKLISGEDYPREMLDQDQQSAVKARVLVDASGRVTKCTSLSHFKLPQFNELVCSRITRNAKFAPAELADGTKVASYYTIKFNFQIAY